MKFEVELIEGGRCIIPMEGNSGLIVADADLGSALRSIKDKGKAPKKRTAGGRPKGSKNKKTAPEAKALEGVV